MTESEAAQQAEGGVGVWVLVPTATAGDRIAAALADRYASPHTQFELAEGPPSEILARVRLRVGGAPLGFVARDEVAALEALSYGADEVLVWPAADDRAIHGFFDRTRLRASLRREQEHGRAAMVHAEKLAALGTLVAGVAHEVNNPLMALQLSIEACLSLLTPLASISHELGVWSARGWGASPEQVQMLHQLAVTGADRSDARQLLQEMLAASSAIGSVVRDLRVFARADERAEAELLDVNDVIDQALRLVGREIGMVAQVERDYAKGLPRVFVPYGRLTQVLLNILINAAHAVNDAPRDMHRVRITSRSDHEYVAISISDTGAGIAADALTHIFDPFFTTKRAGLGTGLGLTISRSILRDLGGDLIVESVHGSGATFIALLPLPDQATLHTAYLQQRDEAPRLPQNKRHTVLVVDEDERVLKAYARMLGSACDVILASRAQEAIELLLSGSRPDALVIELGLPRVDGELLFGWLQQERPGLAARTLFVISDLSRPRFAAVLASNTNPALSKPLSGTTLWAALAALLQRASSSRPPPSL